MVPLEGQQEEKDNQAVVGIRFRSSVSLGVLWRIGDIESFELFKQECDIILSVRVTYVIILSFCGVRLDYNRYPDLILLMSTPQLYSSFITMGFIRKPKNAAVDAATRDFWLQLPHLFMSDCRYCKPPWMKFPHFFTDFISIRMTLMKMWDWLLRGFKCGEVIWRNLITFAEHYRPRYHSTQFSNILWPMVFVKQVYCCIRYFGGLLAI